MKKYKDNRKLCKKCKALFKEKEQTYFCCIDIADTLYKEGKLKLKDDK